MCTLMSTTLLVNGAASLQSREVVCSIKCVIDIIIMTTTNIAVDFLFSFVVLSLPKTTS